jgi:hypothetical protein
LDVDSGIKTIFSELFTHLTQSHNFQPKIALKVCQNDPLYAILGQIFSLFMPFA